MTKCSKIVFCDKWVVNTSICLLMLLHCVVSKLCINADGFFTSNGMKDLMYLSFKITILAKGAIPVMIPCIVN